MAPGVAGTAPKVAARVCATELPQALFALTETLPALLPTVEMILIVVEEPLQVFGKVQV